MFHVKPICANICLLSVGKYPELFHVKPLPIPSCQRFADYAQSKGWLLSDDQQQRIADVAQWLAERASRLGLSKYADLPSVLSYAMAPALAISDLIKLSKVKRAVDLGTGSGSLGLTLSIIQPFWEVTLMDRSSKVINFLEWTVQRLGVENVTICQQDAASATTACDVQYDLVCLRAVAPARQALGLAGPLAVSGGYVVAWHQAQDEGFCPPHSPLPYIATAPTVVPGLVASLYRP